MKGPLSGVRVLDVSRAIAGPYGAMILADLGAEVIHIEPPGGDMNRIIGLKEASHCGESYYFMAFNKNKKSLVLDIATETGIAAFHDLVRKSDVVWDNFRPGVMERLRADYETLKEINPRIICCSVTGFGSSGPYRDRPSFDLVALAISGVMSITGEPDGPPTRPGPPMADMSGASFAVQGVLAALYERERTGRGQRVEVNLLDACLYNLTYQVQYYFCSGVVPQRMGSGHLSLVPFRAYNTGEGYLVIGPSWPRVARTLGIEHVIDDPRFKELDDRVRNREALDAIIEEALARERAEDWLEVMYVDDLPVGPVNTIDRAVADPQVLHNEMIVEMEHPRGGKIQHVGSPFHMASMEHEHQAPPTLGQHSDEVLRGLLGYSDEKVRLLHEEEERHAAELLASLLKQL
ncbi:MAG: CoA transferase [Chloroflexota bacterium]|nr:CoA transferase [Chloroflexota bacterium]